MSDPIDTSDNGAKAMSVFGRLLLEDSTETTSNSLCYSPSPQGKLISALSTADAPMPNKLELSQTSPNENDGTEKTSSESVIDETSKENRPVNKPSNLRIVVEKSSMVPEKATKKPKASKKNSRRDLVKKTQDAINKASASINQSLVAARISKEETEKERQKRVAQLRHQRKAEKDDAYEFHTEVENARREVLQLRAQMSSRFRKAKSERDLQIRQARRDELMKESQFKSEVYREHRRTLKEETDRRRRLSTEARAKLRENHRAGKELMLMEQIKEDSAVIEERYAASIAIRETKREQSEKRRKSFQFRNGDARRIRKLFAEMEAQKKAGEHQSYELKWAGEKDAEAYIKEEKEARRNSFAFRNEEGRRQRESEEVRQSKEREQTNESFELKWVGEKDAEEYKRKCDEQRRNSFAFRNEEGRKQRKKQEEETADQNRKDHDGFELKWTGEKDADEYKKKLEEERRESFAFRNEEASRQRKEEEQAHAQQIISEHESYELKWAGEKDAEEYHEQMEKRRRDSLRGRNEEGARHRAVMDELMEIARQEQEDSFKLKWAGEEDAKAYHARMEEARRQSLAFRSSEGKRHRELEAQMHGQEVQEAHDNEELKAKCKKDVEAYVAECAKRDRTSLYYRRKEARIQRLQEESEREQQLREDEKSHELDAAAHRDVQDYIKECNTRRRRSLAFRAKEKRRQADWEKRQAERELEERSRNVRDRALDRRYIALARQKELDQIALDAMKHAGCTFGSNPFGQLANQRY